MKVVHNNVVIEVSTMDEAKAIAEEAGLDLVEVGPDTYKVMDYGKHLYELKKKAKGNKRPEQECKELQINLRIGPADLDRKIENACEWLSSGKNVRVVMRLRGRLATKDAIILGLFNRIIGTAQKRDLLQECPTLTKLDSDEQKRDISVLLRTNKKPR